VEPVDPVDPVDPVEPVEPVEPVDPVEPVGPSINFALLLRIPDDTITLFVTGSLDFIL
jgi:hypothetical protein